MPPVFTRNDWFPFMFSTVTYQMPLTFLKLQSILQLVREGRDISMPTMRLGYIFFHFNMSYKFTFRWICLYLWHILVTCVNYLITGIFVTALIIACSYTIHLATLLIWWHFRDCLCLFCWSFDWLINWLKDWSVHCNGK